MGENQLGQPSKELTPIEYLEKLCAYAISIGMSYDLYWYGDYEALKQYVEAEKINQRKRNTEMWLQGAYIYQAIGALSPVFNPFSKEHRAKPYLKEPIPITEEERREQEARKLQRFIDFMMSKVKKEGG